MFRARSVESGLPGRSGAKAPHRSAGLSPARPTLASPAALARIAAGLVVAGLVATGLGASLRIGKGQSGTDLRALATHSIASVLSGRRPGQGFDGPALPNFHGLPYDPPLPSPALALTDQHGRAFDLADQRGEVVLLFFGYLSCPDVCPLTLSTLQRAMAGLKPRERAKLRVVMVTVDPERDKPEDFVRYLAAFDRDFLGLSGPQPAVAQVLSDWGIQVQRSELGGGGYLLTHPAQLLVIDRAGQLALSLDHQAPAEEIRADLRSLLALRRGLPTQPPAQAPLGPAPERSGLPPSAWLVSREDGAVLRQSEGGDQLLLPSWDERQPADPINPGQVLGAPTVAFDPASGRLWHSDTHSSIRSIQVDSGMPGPALDGFSDTAIPGCGLGSEGRAFSIDPIRRRLYAPLLTGQVLIYDLDGLEVRGSLPAAAFGDLLLGRYRITAADPGGALWALDAEGNALELDPERGLPTGRRVSAQAEALRIDAGRGLLLLDGPAGSRALRLDSLREQVWTAPPIAGAERAQPLP
jgi:protein SCO1/2